MSSTEIYNGACPLCGKGMIQKYETSGYGYIFDACPWCGYVVDSLMEGDIYNYNDVKRNYIVNWSTILDANKCTSRQELIKQLELDEFTEKDECGFYPTIYSTKDKKSLDVIKKVVKEFSKDTTLDKMQDILKDMEFSDLSIIKYNIEVLKTKELKSYIELKALDIDDKNFNIPMYKGFSYFSPVDLEDNDNNIFIIYEEEDIVVGVLKLGLTTENKKIVRYVSFVDVHSEYRQKGIATNLYREIDDIELESDTIINSPLTKLGKQAKLNDIFKREVNRYKTKTMK